MTTALDAFVALLGDGERPSLPLLAAAAQVPLYADRACQPDRIIEQLRDWGEQLGGRVAADASGPNRLRLLNHFFFTELGFRGAEHDYELAENSYLHRVIERRRGIPITLSLLYMEIGKTAGLRLQGVSFPGHFLVKLRMSDGTAYIDVFGRGATLSADELRARLHAAVPHSERTGIGPYLRAASDREILARLLNNLKSIHWKARQWPEALEVMNRLVAVLPNAAQERRDRALVYERLECPRAAVTDLVAYLSLCAAPPDLAEVRERLARLQKSASRLN
jgi:regulator of sirC expression with transglutaminase-like and TPR domain